MKKILFTFSFLFFVLLSFAQKDTLNVPLGKYGFIKIGDKVYKISASLEEIKEEPKGIFLNHTWQSGIGTLMPATYPIGTIKSDTTYLPIISNQIP